MNLQFDPVLEDFLSFEIDHLQAETELPVELPAAEPGFDINNPDTFPVKSIMTLRKKSYSELSPYERVRAYKAFIKNKDKNVIQTSRSSSGGNTESTWSWTKRMGLRSTKELCKEFPNTTDYQLLTREDGVCGMCFSVNHGYTTDDLEDQAAHLRTKAPEDILTMSWPEQRLFRWSHPEEYAQWVEDLMEEMGPHFDESLVLPEYKFGERPQKAREVVEPGNIIEAVEDYFISIDAFFA